MDLVHPDIQRYIDNTEQPPHPVLRKIEEYADKRGFPIVGPRVGRLLSVLTRATGALRVLELGSGFGYSALWFALGLPEHGRVICTELSEENRDRGIGYLEEAGLAHKVHYQLRNGLEAARAYAESDPEGFDIVFNDIDKDEYPEVPDLASRLLRSGGLFITDNTLWYGTVLEPERADASTRGVLELNRITVAHAAFETSILPVRDGLTVAVKR